MSKEDEYLLELYRSVVPVLWFTDVNRAMVVQGVNLKAVVNKNGKSALIPGSGERRTQNGRVRR